MDFACCCECVNNNDFFEQKKDKELLGMKSAMTQEKRYEMMINMPVSRLIPKLAVPTIISMLVTAVYNMADTFFVSRIGTSASGAVGIIASLMFMIQAIGFTFGMGSGNYISRSLGDQDGKEATRAAATAFFSVLIIGDRKSTRLNSSH